MTLPQLAGVLPAIIFPAATFMQLWHMARRRSAAGVAVMPWVLFGCANLALYIYAERYAEWQMILSMVLTAVLDFLIVALVLVLRKRGLG
jgi:hypothetical protein